MTRMRAAHTVEQVRAAERTLMARLPEGTLMQRAAAGLAASVIDLLGGAYGRKVLVLAGSGDNGGDAAYAGALLARRGAYVELVTVALVAEGVPADVGRGVAGGAGGRLDRARLLAGDPGFAARRDAWRSVPSRLDGTGATVAVVAMDLAAARVRVADGGG